MRKIIYLLTICAVTMAIFSGCNSVGPGRKPLELTEKQKNDLIDYVRFFIVRNKRIASPQEKEYIKQMPPQFRYNVDSDGFDVVSISWELNDGKIIKATGQGILFSRDLSWKVGVVKKAQVEKLKDEASVKAINEQKQKEIFKDFLPLLKK